MSPGALVAALAARGIALRRHERELGVAPRRLLTDADRTALRVGKADVLALLDDLEALERDGTAERLRAIAATLTPDERHRLAAEAAEGDRLAELVEAALAITEGR
jgi:hypothetical protein